MKKLNLNNQDTGDDKALIHLLRTSLHLEPSKEFVNKTIDKLMVLKAKPKVTYKPLRTPLILMIVLSLFLLFPFISVSAEWVLISSPIPDLAGFIEIISKSVDPWYLISPLFVFLGIELLILLELRINKNHNMIR